MAPPFQKGFWTIVGAFLIWGVFPVYWRELAHAPAAQIMAHRIAWCFVFVVGYLTLGRGLAWWRPLAAEPRVLRLLATSGALISLNWWLYIWAVNAGHVVETSLGYFINPLVNVLLGVVILKERLNGRQWLAVLIAASGVAYMTLGSGAPPWIALGLAISFGVYGLIRKVVRVDSIPALGVESALLVVPVAVYLVRAEMAGTGVFGHQGFVTDTLLILSGLVTAVPLAMFAYGAQRIPYTMVGVLQYIAPTLQLGCGVLLFGEPFTPVHAIGFGCIWLALGVYAADGFLRLRRGQL
jgi:chloramphenicol-sensitive protein RarD